jgi:hypothetical protein
MRFVEVIDRRALTQQLEAMHHSANDACEVTNTLMTLRARMSDREASFVVQLHRSARGLRAAASALLGELGYQRLGSSTTSARG